jgi:hypothetical protein
MALVTVLDLLTESLVGIRVHRMGAPVPPEMAEHALTMLGRLLEAWNVDGRYVFRWQEFVTPLTGAASYTIGPGGVITTTRPLAIQNGFTRLAGNDYPYDVIGLNVYNAIGYKGQQGLTPVALYYDAAYPLGVLYPWPLGTAGALHVFVEQPLAPLVLNVTLSLPPDYADALTYALGRRLASAYGQTLDATYVEEARKAESGLRRRAHQPQYATVHMPAGHQMTDSEWIWTGGF